MICCGQCHGICRKNNCKLSPSLASLHLFMFSPFFLGYVGLSSCVSIPFKFFCVQISRLLCWSLPGIKSLNLQLFFFFQITPFDICKQATLGEFIPFSSLKPCFNNYIFELWSGNMSGMNILKINCIGILPSLTWPPRPPSILFN